MSVAHPWMAVAAVAAVAVPILIHLLLRRRRRVIQWAAMELLQRAMRRDRRRQRIERWLLLACRCAIVALAGLALARPFTGSGAGEMRAVRTIWLIIDDGVAGAERLPDGGTVLDRSIAEAKRIVEGSGPGDRVGVILASTPIRRLVDPPTADRTRLDALLSQIEPAYAGSDLARAIGEAADAAGSAEDAGEIIVLGGWRRGSLDPASPSATVDPAVASRWRLRAQSPVTSPSSDAWIAAVEPLRLGDEASISGERVVRVRVERRGAELPRSLRRVTAEAPFTGAADLSFEAGERRAGTELRLRGGDRSPGAVDAVTIDLDPDTQPRDDRLHAVLPSDQPARVVVLDRRSGSVQDLERLGAGVWVTRALAPGRGPSLQVESVDPGALDRGALAGADAAIVARPDLLSPEGWRLLRDFVDGGAALVVTPSPGDSGQRWTERFRSAIAPSWRLDAEVEVAEAPWRLAPQQPSSATLRMLGSELSMLAAPVTASRRMRLSAPASDAEPALVFDDGEALLLCGRPSGGSSGWVMVLAVAPELSWSDLPVRPIMVPLMQELVRQGRMIGSTEGTNLVGSPALLPRGGAALVLRPPPGGAVAAGSILQAGTDRRTRGPVSVPGLHEVIDDSGRTIGRVAVNVDPARANIEPNDPAAVLAWLQRGGPWRWIGDGDDDASSSATAESESNWSLALLAAAIAVALAETVLARLLSRGDAMERPA